MNKIGQYLSGLALLLLSLFIWDACTVRKTIDSPHGRFRAELRVKGGVPYMDVWVGDEYKWLTVRLGMNTSEGNFDEKVKIEAQVDAETVDNEYHLSNGKQSWVKTLQTIAVYKLVNSSGYRMEVEVRMGEDGVAFRYRIPGKRGIRVSEDFTTFYFPQEAVGFLQPMQPVSQDKTGSNFNYETLPVVEVPLSTRSEDRLGWCYPALVKHSVNDSLCWTLISETGVRGNYCATHLADADSLGGLKIAYPIADVTHEVLYPTFNNATPWRVIVLSDGLKDIVENTWMTDLVRTEIEPKRDYRSGRAAWSWLTQQNAGTVFDEQQRYIDMAARLGFEYCVIDEFWNSQIGNERIQELIAYARARRVGIWLWYDSASLATSEQRREVLGRLKRWGVYGIKVNFRSGDEQTSMQQYEALLRDANEYGLAVSLHGTTVPRGWERIYPNLLTSEAVMGMQYAVESQAYENNRARHIAGLVFTRNVAGPMDFTPVMLDRRLGADPMTGAIERSTTAAFELALPVLLCSGVQSYGITPDNLQQYPACVGEYLSSVPATWDETRFIDGYPGEYAVLARRVGEHWFIAAINAGSRPLDLSVDASFTGQSEFVQLQSEGLDSIRRDILPATRLLKLHLAPNDGAVWY